MTETQAKVGEQSGHGGEAAFQDGSKEASGCSIRHRTQEASTQAGETRAATDGRLRLATVWLGGCSGCHMSFLDLDEDLIELAGKIDLVYSPVIDVKEYPLDVDVCLVEGAV